MSAALAGINRSASSLEPVLKEFYIDEGRVRKMEFQIDPFLSKFHKNQNFEYSTQGKFAVVPIGLDRMNTAAKEFATSQTLSQSKSGKWNVWQVPMDVRYCVARVDLQTLHATRGKRGSFVKAILEKTDRSVENLVLARSADFWSDGTGIQGKVRATKTTGGKGIIQLDSRYVMARFAQDQDIDVFDGANQRGATVTIERVDRAKALIYLSGALPANIAADDDIYLRGEQGKTHMLGVPAWIKDVSGETESFANVMRNTNPQKYGGVTLTPGAAAAGETSQQKVTDALIDAPSEIRTQTGVSASLDVFACHDLRLSWLIKNLGRDVSYERTQVNVSSEKAGELGFDVVVIRTASQKPVYLMSSPWIDPNKIFGLDYSSWERLFFTEDIVSFNSFDGLDVLRVHNDDSIEIRGYSWMNLVCKTPGANCVIDLQNHKLDEPALLT